MDKQIIEALDQEQIANKLKVVNTLFCQSVLLLKDYQKKQKDLYKLMLSELKDLESDMGIKFSINSEQSDSTIKSEGATDEE